jgi:hypothetical protein
VDVISDAAKRDETLVGMLIAERWCAGDEEKELRRKEKAKGSEPDMQMSGDGRLTQASNLRGNM